MSRIADRSPAVVALTSRLSRADLLWVANTAHGPAGHWHARARPGQPDHDHLADADSARRYLADHRVPVPTGLPDLATLGALAAIRTAVQRLVDGEPDAATAATGELLRSTTFQVAADGTVAAPGEDWPAFARNLLLPLVALIRGGMPPGRCSNPLCRLVFEDGSRNGTRRWCDNAGCGNRSRVQRARGRSGACA